jgi:hypothetical protein
MLALVDELAPRLHDGVEHSATRKLNPAPSTQEYRSSLILARFSPTPGRSACSSCVSRTGAERSLPAAADEGQERGSPVLLLDGSTPGSADSEASEGAEELLARLPDLGDALRKAPIELKRQVFEAFCLQITYDKPTGGLRSPQPSPRPSLRLWRMSETSRRRSQTSLEGT